MNKSIEKLQKKYTDMKYLVEDESDAMQALYSSIWSMNVRASELCNGCALDGDAELQVARIMYEISEDFATEVRRRFKCNNGKRGWHRKSIDKQLECLDVFNI